jgi:hypothetical protein
MKIDALIEDSSWAVAKSTVDGLGNFHNLLTQVTKTLERLGPTSKEGGATCYFIMRSLLSSHQMRAKFLYAMFTIYPQESDGRGLTFKTLYSKFKPAEMSVISAGIFCFHLAKKVTSPEFIPELEKDIQEYSEVGMLCGHVLPKIGLEKGLLVGLLRPLAFVAFSKKDPKGYGQYRSDLKKAKVLNDIKLEAEIFKCQHSQVISLIAQKLGFSRRLSQDLYMAFASNISSLTGESAALRVLIVLIDSLMSGEGLPPESVMDYRLLGASRTELVEALKPAIRVNEIGSLHAWMGKGERDVTTANSPDLFEQVPGHFYEDDFDFKSIPASVRQEFSFEDFASFRSVIKDIIGDDEEQ